ncbi:hypothetical protein [Streptomyces sp. GC420]|uniref:hypothetical protein n=1 Tax=Streptomyces sp. GC420 TaxID=2697568 RepID=UPI001414E68F|nr:hypothetical protein [Streptomyces sp. GC420]NBM20506.1 hypothetical protein [Streptomyces sp. GC420]
MSSATFTPGPPGRAAPHVSGATAVDSAGSEHPRHLIGNALRAIKVFLGAAISVVVLGEYNETKDIPKT